ncbi:hypothetical protein RA210_U20205 [Rubrivivax sp. A210]|nr:hypothetical protein RA210_U20205 [Rubrivivax sp. A210]
MGWWGKDATGSILGAMQHLRDALIQCFSLEMSIDPNPAAGIGAAVQPAPGAPSHKLRHCAGVVQWQNGSFPSFIRGFDSLHPLQLLFFTRRGRLIQVFFAPSWPHVIPEPDPPAAGRRRRPPGHAGGSRLCHCPHRAGRRARAA